jgi:hypothetical protein
MVALPSPCSLFVAEKRGFRDRHGVVKISITAEARPPTGHSFSAFSNDSRASSQAMAKPCLDAAPSAIVPNIMKRLTDRGQRRYSDVIIRVARVSCSNPGAFIPVEWS